tara:strand:+ start:2184 stop:2474 length:291 start_codon:yes stop_codon:yes gene_type:complete
MEQFKRGDMVVRKSLSGKQTTIELYEHYHKYHGCLGIVMQVKSHSGGVVVSEDLEDKMYQVRWFKPNGDGDWKDHWYQDYQIGHLDGRHRWDNATV